MVCVEEVGGEALGKEGQLRGCDHEVWLWASRWWSNEARVEGGFWLAFVDEEDVYEIADFKWEGEEVTRRCGQLPLILCPTHP